MRGRNSGVGLKVALAVLVVAAAGSAGAASADNPALTGVVGTNDAFQISLSDSNGAVKHLAAGTYTLLVHDRSALHDFHLSGPGVDVATTIEGTGDQNFTVTLADGTYTFRCDAHFTTMKGTFTVGAATAPPPAPAPTQKLSASLVGSKTVLHGVAGLSPGKVAVTIADKSNTDGFVLKGPGVSKATGVGFTGKAAWTVTLQAGKYVYGSLRHPARRLSFLLSG
jgi:plastocyanin